MVAKLLSKITIYIGLHVPLIIISLGDSIG